MMEDDDSNSEKQDMNTSETIHSLVTDTNQKSNTSQDNGKAPLSMSNIESEAETTLEEEGRTDSQKTNGLEFFGVSQDPPDKEKMMDADQSNIESVEEMELVEVGKIDSQKTNVSDNYEDKTKIPILMMDADQGIECVKDMDPVDVGR